MKRRISSLVSIGLLALLTACGGGGGGDSTPTPPPPVQVDTTPNAFTFTAQSGTALSSVVASNEITVSGINAAAPVSITGGEYSINGGAFTSAAGSVSDGQRIQVRVTGSSQFATPSSAVLTVGGATATFIATTLVADTTPDAFSFASQSGVALSTVVTSNEITISGINTNAIVTVTGGEYSIDGGAFTAAAGSAANAQRICVRLTSAAQFAAEARATLTVGGVSSAFAVTTGAADTVPDAFQVPRKVNATRGAWVASNSVSIAGINTTTPISVSDGEYSIAGGAFTSAAGSINPGQSFVVRARAASGYSRVTRARITVGTVAADFEVTSELPTYVPDNIAFDGQDIVYLLSNTNRAIFRWSVGESRYLEAYSVGVGALTPVSMAYSSAHHRVYLGYDSGAIRQIDVNASNPAEAAFATMSGAVTTLGYAGNFLIAQVGSYYYGGGYILSASGATTGQGGNYYGYSRETAWDPVTSRLYFTRDGTSPNDLHFDVIDQTTGVVTANGETPYHGSYNILPPIRVSADGHKILLGSGDIYGDTALDWLASLGSQVTDARWFGNGALVTLATANNQTTLRRLGAATRNVLEQQTYTGTAVRVVGTDTRMAVLVTSNNALQIHTYVPNDDIDGDGVANTEDAFPNDRAASVDTDRDGRPDAWNPGRTQADSTTGLTLDAFPQDSACWLAAHGSGGVCNYAATMANYTPDQIVQNGDLIYLLSIANKRVYRWSISAAAYVNPYVVGLSDGLSTIAPAKMAYSAGHQRLYFGYETGAIQFIDTSGTSATERPFANTALGVGGLASVGNYVLAQDHSGAWATHYIFDSAGAVKAMRDWNYYSSEYAWDPVNSRVYFFRDDTSPNDLHYEVINQQTGEISLTGETPYHGSYNIQPPIRVSVDGQNVLLGSGDLYTQPVLNWSGSLGGSVADARWLADGSLVTLTTASNQTTLRRLGTGNLAVLEQLPFTGQALRVLGTDARMTVIVLNGGAVQFLSYVPDDDSDNDGVLNTADAFPLDAAASIDTDSDGYPDAWNAGRSQADSTTGLVLDAFPQDSACYLPAHGTGGVCNNAATMPNYTPDKVVQSGDIIYLLSSANKRVYRWSISAGAYINPYVVGINQGFSTVAPVAMDYSASQHRLYLGYGSGVIRYIDVNAGPAEVAFATMPAGVSSLSSAGNFIVAQVSVGYNGGYVLNASGAITGMGGYYYGYSRETAWDPVNSRLYYFRDGISPNDLHYDVINQTTGEVTSQGETPYHGDYSFGGVIRVTADGQTILLGTGDMYAQSAMTWSGTLGSQVPDARWLANGSLVTLTTSGNQTLMRRLGSGSLATLEQLTYAGQALRVVGTDAAMVVLVLNSNTVQFHSYVPNNDSDGDGVLNTADAFPLDVAASADSDRDGYPNAWNTGRSQADSTTGLTLDAFAQDSACWLAAHGSAGVCNYGSTVPNYTPDQIVQNGDIVYLLSAANRRVYRWSISAHAYRNPYIVGINQGLSTIGPAKIAYSAAQQRLYVGYSTGAIRYLNASITNPAEVTFATPAANVTGLTSAGNYLVAHTGNTYGYGTTYVLNASGATTDFGNSSYSYGGTEYAWDPVTLRVYAVSDGYSYYGLNYETIDPSTGELGATGNSSYNSSSTIRPPVRVSANGQYIVLGNGDFYAQSGLTYAGSLGAQVADARWFANGTLATLTTANNQTVLRRHAATTLTVLEQVSYTGQALRVVGSDTLMVVIALNGGAVQFTNYVPNNDSDGDGVANTADAFPLDVAASVDTDRDGYPDAWNAGRTQADSTTGLVLDAFPTESACWLAAHGSGGVCNYGATVGAYTPDKIAQRGDIIYLLSTANRRVYRWSMTAGAYISPYVVGVDLGLSTAAPTTMAYSPNHQRLYLGYANGAIRYIDVTGSSAEVALTTMQSSISSLASAGNFLLAQVGNYSYGGGYVLNSAGVTTDQGGYYYGYSRETAWDPSSSRIYYLRDGISPNDLHYDVIDQTTGEVTSTGETPYHGEYNFNGPIRVSTDSQQILLGSGDIYARTGLTRASTLGKAITDAQWTGNILVDVDNTDFVEIRDANSRTVLQSYQYQGQPLRLMFGTSEAYLVHVVNGTTAFVRLPFYDQDGDQIARWWEQAYGLSDANAADATSDLDGDGVNNRNEYLNLSNPTVSDTDADGLTDSQEIVTYHTHPGKRDTDGDGLSDYAEVITHHCDPLDTDSDNDSYIDLDEVLYGGNPNDASVLPQPMTSYSQTFEGSPNLAAWTTPSQGSAPWAIDALTPHAGSASLSSGAVATSQSSAVRFRGFFRPGQLGFWARVDNGSCCNRLQVMLDGAPALYIAGNSQWTNYQLTIPVGIHEIEWRFDRDPYAGQPTDAARIDDVVFTGQ